MPHTPAGSNGDDERHADGSGGGGPGEDPVEISDGREKHVSILTADGERIERGDVFLRHSTDGFAVSDDPAFPAASTDRYAKSNLLRIEVKQHHSACFITTAAAGEGETLDALRAFRDGWLARSAAGRALVAGYERVSPPVARTLARHPDARTTRLVRWLVGLCARLARRQAGERSSVRSTALGVALGALYVVGVALAAAGHAAIRARELAGGERLAPSPVESTRLTRRRTGEGSRSD